MCDKELLLGYLYGELQASERERFDRHAATCAACRDEVQALAGTRAHLARWAPPEPDLGFEIVRRPHAASAPPVRWRPSPRWALAAAAMLMLAVSAAIANVEVRAGSDGFVVRTGWHRGSGAPIQTASQVSVEELQRIAGRVNQVEAQLADRAKAGAAVLVNRNGAAVLANNPTPDRMSDAEIVRMVRSLIAASEERQGGMLARQILQVNRDSEAARRADFDRLLTGLRQVQGTTVETVQRQRAIEDHLLLRAGMQR